MSQQKHILNLFTKNNILICKSSDTLIEVRKNKVDLGKPVDTNRYKRLVGKLIYLSYTKPDITFTISIATQHMQSPKKVYLKAVYKIFKYHKESSGKELFFKRSETKVYLLMQIRLDQ